VKKTLLVIAPIVLGLATLSVQSFAQVATQKTEKPIWMEPIGSKIESDSTVIFDFGLSSRFNSSYVSPFDKLVTEHPVNPVRHRSWSKNQRCSW
jgi:hypothetical protein